MIFLYLEFDLNELIFGYLICYHLFFILPAGVLVPRGQFYFFVGVRRFWSQKFGHY